MAIIKAFKTALSNEAVSLLPFRAVFTILGQAVRHRKINKHERHILSFE